jgi:hypothetical protein
MSKTKLWWASVGGNDCEPVRVGRKAGKEVFYSIGCADAHPLDGVTLVQEFGDNVPLTPAQSEHQRKLSERAFKRAVAAGNYSYRQWD